MRPLGCFAHEKQTGRMLILRLNLSYPRKRVSRGHDPAAQVGADRRSRKGCESASGVALCIPAFAGMTWDLRARPESQTL